MKTAFALLAAIVLAMPLTAGTVHRELPASAGEELLLTLRSGGAVEIQGWDRNAVDVVVTTPGDDSSVAIERMEKGVKVGYSGQSRHARLRIQVPRTFDLTIRSNGGEIAVENVEGTMLGSTLGGGIRLAGLAGSITMKTNGGDITIRDSVVGGLAETMGGHVLLENVGGDLKAKSMGGNVTSRQTGGRPETQAAVDLSTMGGNVLVERAPNGASVSTMGGNVVVRSAGKSVRAKSMGGNVELTAIDGSIDASTMGGNVSVVVTSSGPGSRDVSIESKGGDVDLVVPAGFPMDIDVEILVGRPSAEKFGIQSDFPVVTTTNPPSATSGPRRIRGKGQTGAATHKVRIRTVDGDVRLKRAGQ